MAQHGSGAGWVVPDYPGMKIGIADWRYSEASLDSVSFATAAKEQKVGSCFAQAASLDQERAERIGDGEAAKGWYVQPQAQAERSVGGGPLAKVVDGRQLLDSV